MSLIHWWPLNGDPRDKIQGEILQTTSTTFSSGKTSQCLQLQSCESKVPNPFIGLDDWSLCFWMRDDGGAIWSDFVCFSDNLNRLEIHVSSNIWYWYSSSTASGNFLPTGTSIKTDRVVGRWYHIAMVKSKNNAWLYIDGELASSGTTASNFTNASSYLHFNSRASSSTSGKTSYNDIRAYDHALSQAEVKELSKALVVHYTFDDILAEPTTNLVAQGALGWSKLTVNVSASHSAGVYTITTTAANSGTSGQIRANFPLAILTTGATYYFSCKYKVVSGAGAFSFSDWCDSSLSDTKIKNCGDFYEMSTKCYTTRTYNNTYRFLDFNISANSVVEVWDVQLQTNDKVTPYALGTRESLIRNEAETIQPSTVSNIVLAPDAASGNYSLKCAGLTYLQHTPTGDGSNATASFWLKNFSTSGQMVVFADTNSKLAFGPYSTYSCISCQSGVASQVATSEINKYWNNSAWNHVAVRKNSSNEYSCFINGVKVTNTAGDHWTHDTYLSIGCRISGNVIGRQMTGLIDDFRLYYTYLSDSDIQDLYETKAYITDKNDIMCSEFVESKNEAGVTEKSTFDCKEVYEQLDIGSDYERAEYIEFSETQYVDTGLAFTDASVPIIIEADIMKTAISSNDCLAGCGIGSSWHGPVMLNCHNYTLELGVNGYATASDGSGSIALNERMSIRAEIYTSGNDHRWYKNGNRINLGSGAYKDRTGSNSTLYIGAFHNGTSNSIASGSCWIGRLYSFRVWYGDSCRILIPAKRKSDNAFGLYDMAEHNFYPNIGGGSLSGIPALTNAAVYQDGRIGGREIIEI